MMRGSRIWIGGEVGRRLVFWFMSQSNRYSTESTVLPALAAVVATAVLFSMAVTTGATPRLAPADAIQAVFLRSATACKTVLSRTVARQAVPLSVASSGMSPLVSAWNANDIFEQVAPAGPARGNLPPPMV